MRTGHVRAVAPFRYSMVLWAIVSRLRRLAAKYPDAAAGAGICNCHRLPAFTRSGASSRR